MGRCKSRADRYALRGKRRRNGTVKFSPIKHVRAFVVRGGGADYHDQGGGHWIDDHIATPMSRYPEYRQSRQSFGINVLGTLVVEIEAENGVIGFAVTTGHGLKEIVEKFKADHDDYNAIMAEAIADRLAEAFAEYLHKRVRDEWGFGKTENLSSADLIEEKYRGIRPAAGYPACPDHTEKGILWDLLDVEKHTGIKLTESFAMWPGSSVSGLYFAHPDSKYFAVGKLGRDQIEDLARRKGVAVTETEKWLGPWLNYNPS